MVTVNTHILPKLLLYVSFRELHNIMVSLTEEGGIKEVRDKENDIVINDLALRTMLPPQQKNMEAH